MQQFLQLPAWNEALGLPRPWDQQWSLRMQQILAYETDLLEFGDLFDGNPVIEAKVDELSGSLLNLETMVNTIEWTTQSKQVRVPVSAGRSGMCAFGVLKPDACRGS